MGSIAQVSSKEWSTEVKGSSVPVLVDFYAEWCGPCKMMTPVVEKIAQQYGEKLKVLKLDTDENADIATEYQIMGVPTLIIFKGGEVAARSVGYMNEKDMTAFVARYVS